MDILAARQETVFKYFKEALIARLADSEEPKDKKQDTDNSKIVETTTSTAKAVAGLAHRIDTLTQDMSTIRQVLGIRAKSTEREETDAAKYIKRERLTRAITTGKPSGVAAGGSPSNAIDIDGLDETSGPGEDGAKGEEQNVVAAQRTIIDRLDSMEMDFAEFMERVRDPDANVDGLRGQSSFSNAAGVYFLPLIYRSGPYQLSRYSKAKKTGHARCWDISAHALPSPCRTCHTT